MLSCTGFGARFLTLRQLEDMDVSHLEFRLQRTGMNPVADLATMRDLRRIMAEVRPDHVLGYTIKPVIYGCLAAGRQKVPAFHAMITGLGTTFLGSGLTGTLLNTFARFMYRSALKECRTVFFQNRDDLQLFLDGNLVGEKQTVLINGSGVNLERFSVVPVPTGRCEFLMIGRLIQDKGIGDFVAAARLVKRRYPEAVFRVVGMFDNHPGGITRGQMDQWTAEGLLVFDGPTDDVRGALADCTVYCLPSYREGMPRSMGQVSRGLAEEKFDVHRVNEKILAKMGL